MMQKRERQHLEEIFAAGLRRVDPEPLIRKLVSVAGNRLTVHRPEEPLEFDLDAYRRILVLGTGKASARMARGLESVLGDRITEGLVCVKYGHAEPLQRIEILEAGHPVPDEKSLEAGHRIGDLARTADERTLVINLISGGGSALLVRPLEIEHAGSTIRLTLEEKQQTTRLLLACGATIQEINCIRKHLSAVKGGRLAAMVHPAPCLSLILSDVVGDRLDTIASGLTVGDATTFGEALGIVDKYGLGEKIPAPVRAVLQLGAEGKIAETPKPADPALARATNLLIGTNYDSLAAAAGRARELGYHPIILTSQVTGEAREMAKFFVGLGKDVRRRGLLAPLPACILAGGETTVTLRGEGKGGRNQEMALAFLAEIRQDPAGCAGLHFLSGATDGGDGPTDAAGAFASVDLLRQAEEEGLAIGDYLKNNDSYHFFDRLGALLKTGPTHTNVCDLQILILTT